MICNISLTNLLEVQVTWYPINVVSNQFIYIIVYNEQGEGKTRIKMENTKLLIVPQITSCEGTGQAFDKNVMFM